MDIIHISGLNFKIKPGITVQKVLDVFKACEKVGILQRDGIVEYLDNEIELDTSHPYIFIDSRKIWFQEPDLSSSIQPINPTSVSAVSSTQVQVTESNGISTSMANVTSSIHATQASPVLTCENIETNANMPFLSLKPIKATSYQEIYLQGTTYLHINQIEAFNENGVDVTRNAKLESSPYYIEKNHPVAGMTCEKEKAVNGKKNEILNYFHSACPGGYLRLIFPDIHSVSKIIITNRIEQPHRLKKAKIEFKNIVGYNIDRDLYSFTFNNPYPDKKINLIRIKAEKGRLLKLKQIEIYDTTNLRVDDKVLSLVSPDLRRTRTDIEAKKLLFRAVESSEDFVMSTKFGSFIELKFNDNLCIKSVIIKSLCSIKGMKLTMEKVDTFYCTNENMQSFSI